MRSSSSSKWRRVLLGPSLSDYREKQSQQQRQQEMDPVEKLARVARVSAGLPDSVTDTSGAGNIVRQQAILNRPTPPRTPKRQALLDALEVLHRKRQDVFVGLSQERRATLRLMAEYLLQASPADASTHADGDAGAGSDSGVLPMLPSPSRSASRSRPQRMRRSFHDDA